MDGKQAGKKGISTRKKHAGSGAFRVEKFFSCAGAGRSIRSVRTSSFNGMNKRSVHITFFFSLLGVLLLTSCPLRLQAQNEIIANDSAKLLRRIWMVRGGVVGGDRVGALAGALGDLNKDSLQDFIWGVGSTGIWHVQYGGMPIAETPAQSFYHRSTLSYPVTGDFWGTDTEYVVFSDAYFTNPGGRTRIHTLLKLYAIESDTINLTAVETFDPARGIWPDLETTVTAMFAVDLDRDEDDELVVKVSTRLVGEEVDRRAEVWIFEGGPEFQLDTPKVVLKDTEENITDCDLTIGNLDGDLYPDLILAANYYAPELVNRLKFWWGGPDLSQLSRNPERTLTLNDPDTYPNVSFAVPFMPLFDSDGDSVDEFMLPGADGDWYYYNMNAPGKDPRTRPLTLADAERSYRGYNKPYKVGYLNDSTRRYEMVGRTGGDPGGGARMVVLSGGKDGPNPTYDAYYSAAADGMTAGNVFGRGGIVENCTGTGWDCYLTANPEWFNLQQGIAILLEGGPYIPNDDTTLSVQSLATDEHQTALHIWPNPVRDLLHVAWRGDLQRPPGLLRVYDMNGRLIVEGPVEAWRGEALWRCGSVPPGGYLLVICDRQGGILAQTTVIKQ